MTVPATMPVIVVGGCAAGTVLKAVRVDAQEIELSAPLYTKPVTSADAAPEVVRQADTYEIHPLALVNNDSSGKAALLGVGVVKGMSLTAAFAELINAYAEKIFTEAVSRRLQIAPPKKH